MVEKYVDIANTHQFGTRTKEWRLDAGTCPIMRNWRILWTGWTAAAKGYYFERQNPNFGGIISCYAGQGRVRIGKKWMPCGAGSGYLTPAHQPHGYYSTGATPWGIVWAAFDELPGSPPMISVEQPSLIKADPEFFRSAILGLQREWSTTANLEVISRWLWLVHHYAARLADQKRTSERLWKLWEQVEANIAAPWSTDTMAEFLTMSTESVRRICLADMGSTPMQWVAHLRMQRAAGMLTTTNLKIRVIAQSVGYDNEFCFSTAFRRHYGVPPSQYRRSHAL